MADIKLIATDLDGTFMYDYRTPHPDNVRALMRCRERGIAVCLCTGRNFHGIRDLVATVPFDRYCVINNGTAIYDLETNSLRYRNRFSPEAAVDILTLCAGYEGVHLSAVTTYSRHILEDRLSSEKRARFMALEPEDVFLHESVAPLVAASEDDMQRIILGLDIGDVDMLREVYERISAISEVEITSSGPSHMEISPKGGTKAEALTILADIYGAKPENVLAFGDNFNDLYMLMWAGTGVAMGNADERLKAVVDYVTETNTEGGVARAIERIVFNEH